MRGTIVLGATKDSLSGNDTLYNNNNDNNNNNNNNNNNFICIAVYTKALYRFTIKKENN